jgi:hypothetical protein
MHMHTATASYILECMEAHDSVVDKAAPQPAIKQVTSCASTKCITCKSFRTKSTQSDGNPPRPNNLPSTGGRPIGSHLHIYVQVPFRRTSWDSEGLLRLMRVCRRHGKSSCWGNKGDSMYARDKPPAEYTQLSTPGKQHRRARKRRCQGPGDV